MEKKHKRLIGKVRQECLRTIRKHGLIKDGDSVLIGISGGKDSLVLTEVLSEIRRFAQVDYKLHACHIKVKDMPYEIDKEYLYDFCQKLDVQFHYIEREYERRDVDKSPCYFCAWTRRKVFFSLSKELGCNKLATGHHMDDAIETLFMNMIYHGSMSSFPQKFSMFDGRLEFIRPLLEIPEQLLREYAGVRNYPQLKTECPHDAQTKRTETRELIESVCKDFPQARVNLFNAMRRINEEYLPD